ncbi:Aspartyl/Asparaginyl beta-hydroxylase-domain-containing protein [Ochromonadaceae sp. CCMP2298]|nr:Aspartyl/Asparaginyl beta-hydroxylase-domain-containing protein [Ochromonadaceae sp. CCMP2298]
MSSVSLADKIASAVTQRFQGQDVARVVSCWTEFSKGNSVNKFLDDDQKINQQADCYVAGLSANPFHDMQQYPWANSLASSSGAILQELRAYNSQTPPQLTATPFPNPRPSTGPTDSDPADTEGQREQEWLPPRDLVGGAYGPQWKTLGLQDRGVWEEERALCFPHTVGLMRDLGVPSCEAFFARQGPESGIQPHSDKNNFILTCHVGLDVPEGQCWIQVGKDIYYWRNGEAVVFDTSVIHSTRNDAQVDRTVLLIRFWHPELTVVEREAFSFIFDYLDHSAYGEEALQQFETRHLFLGTDKPKVSPSTPSSSSSSPAKKGSGWAVGGVGKKGQGQGQGKREKPAPSSKGFGIIET